MKMFDVIVFDLDSTLVKIEGLDWLASLKEKSEEVHLLTSQSMGGKIDFYTAMTQKMKVIKPSGADFLKLGEEYCNYLTDGAQEVIATFQSLGKEVWIITGNFEPAVQVVAKKLGISSDRVLCNTVFFDRDDNYTGFDEDNALSHNHGKAKKIMQMLNGRKKSVAFVGDGMTDLEVKGSVDLFVGFGGVVEREIVKQNSDVYITESSLLPLLEILLTEDEQSRIG